MQSVGTLPDSESGIHDIVSCVREQSSATNDIARHIEKIVQMIQSNHHEVTCGDGVARQLEELSQGLLNEVRRFKLA